MTVAPGETIALPAVTIPNKLAEANHVTVFEYTGMIWAPLWGFLFFGESPRWMTLVGMGLIVVAGVYSLMGAAAERRELAPESA